MLYQRYFYFLTKEITPEFLKNSDSLIYLDGGISYQFTPEKIELNKISLTLDQTSVSGAIGYEFLEPKINANLSLGDIDADRYLALLPKEPEQNSDTNKTPGSEYISWLKQLKGQGEISVSSVKYQDTLYRGVKMQFSSD